MPCFYHPFHTFPLTPTSILSSFLPSPCSFSFILYSLSPFSLSSLILYVYLLFLKITFLIFLVLFLHHLPPIDSAVSEDAGIEPRTVATLALPVRRSTLLKNVMWFLMESTRFFYSVATRLGLMFSYSSSPFTLFPSHLVLLFILSYLSFCLQSHHYILHTIYFFTLSSLSLSPCLIFSSLSPCLLWITPVLDLTLLCPSPSPSPSCVHLTSYISCTFAPRYQ